jgi:HAMP domain-containing protein
MKLRLAIKFNLISLAVFAICLASAGEIADRMLQKEALEQTRHVAAVLLSAADAMNVYTMHHVTPLLQTQNKYAFVPESVPALSAVRMLDLLQKNLPAFAYRAAVLDPTNPRDRPTGWEAKVIAQLQANPHLAQLSGQRDAQSGGGALFLAQPIRMTDVACMQCHSTAGAAPRTMVDQYGSAHGFGWPMNRTIGAEFVSVPMAQAVAQARAMWRAFMLSMAAVFAVVLVLLNVMVHVLVTRRIQSLSRIAEEMSLGKLDGTLPTGGSDEIASLADSFARMQASLVEAFRILNEGQA